MGWKNIKEHYRIGHIVQVTDKGICIGSPYIHNLITIHEDGTVHWGALGPSCNDDLARYFAEMTADKEALLGLMGSTDTFTKSIAVFTFDGSDIIEKQCEEPGWPNATHDGLMMYDNAFSTDKAKVVRWAKENAECGIEWKTERCAELRKELNEQLAELETSKQHRAKLEADYPTRLN